ncbi:LysR family transcriptional regulator [Pseudomonas sp. MAG733B]|jgi:DNA-binding transcriptional LysR family regulator|uniref:LysR family transcriptional regulator n=1 Tax=unclassified Pseudomonas TaxID=196821 RepID=UPI0030CD606B
MELAQIRMFKTVAEVGSIARAAELLHCVPSNITARIKSLEAELGVALFLREGRGLRISPSGQTFLAYASKILALTAEAKRAVDPSADPSGPLRIGAIESSATGRLPRLLAKFHKRFPQVALELTTGTWAQLLDDTFNHKLDGAIVAVDVERSQLKRTPMYREELLVIASTSLGPLHDVADLHDKTMFLWPQGCPYRAAMEHWLLRNGLSLPIVSLASYGAIVGCVSAGAGVALVTKGVFDQYAKGAGCVAFEFPELTAIESLFYWHENAGVHPAREAFVAMLREEFA